MTSIKLIVILALASVACCQAAPQADTLQTFDTTSVQAIGQLNDDPYALEKFFDIGSLFNEKYIHKKISELCVIILPHLKGHPKIKAVVEKIHFEIKKHSSSGAIITAIKPIIESIFRPFLGRIVNGIVTGLVTSLYNIFVPIREAAVLATSGISNVGQVFSDATNSFPQQFILQEPEPLRQSFFIAPPQMLFRKRRDVQNSEDQMKNDLQLPTVLHLLRYKGRSQLSEKREEDLNMIKS